MLLLNIWNTITAWLPDNFQGVFITSREVIDTEITSVDSRIVSYWIVFFVFFALLLLGLLCKTKMIERLSRHLLPISFVVWFFGVIVYIIGFYECSVNGFSVVLRAIIASFKMFVVTHELSQVVPSLHTDVLYISIFSLLHFVAAFVTFLFIFKMLGFRVKSSLRLIINSYFGHRNKTVHLFWGVNAASCQLAKNISKHPCHSRDTIIFVDIDNENSENSQKKVTLDRITNAITISDNEIDIIEDIGALVDHCYNGPASLSDNNDNDIFSSLRLRNVGKIVRKSNMTHFYFLSEDESQNITGALNMLHDTSIRKNVDGVADIFVHARRDAGNEVFDYYSQYDGDSNGLKIKIIDSAYLSVETLKSKDGMLPVNTVNVERTTGLVYESFNAIIVGFGSTGREAFKYLYEFSAFVGPDMKRIPFKCYAIDSKMNEIEGAVKVQMSNIGDDELILIEDQVDSKSFWERCTSLIDKLNFVVVALNNDTLGLSFTVNLFRYAMTKPLANDRKLKIALRVYDSCNTLRMESVVNKLNSSIDGDRVLICLFGSVEDIYTCDNVLLDSQFVHAKEFNLVYENSMKESENDKMLSASEQWRLNFGNEAIQTIMEKYGISRYHAICDINRRIAQNLSNASHCRTKMILMGFDKDENLDRLKSFNNYINTRDRFTTKYYCDEESAILLRNMAVVEHERWTASHRLMGYAYGTNTDYVMKLHDNIYHWSMLNEVAQSYDCNVVDTTIKIEYKRLNKL